MNSFRCLKQSFILEFCPSTYFIVEWFFFDHMAVLISGFLKKGLYLANEKILNLVFVTNIKHSVPYRSMNYKFGNFHARPTPGEVQSPTEVKR